MAQQMLVGANVRTVDRAARITVDLLARFLGQSQPRDFAVRLWNGETLPAQGEPRFTLVLKHAGALRKIFRPPTELALGESFLRGDFDIEGDIIAAFGLQERLTGLKLSPSGWLSLVRALLALPDTSPGVLTRPRARLRGRIHSRDRDRAAISYHYDVGNEFYALWLDRRMIYSCAYFPTGTEDLDTAQENKLEHICRKLRLQKGERLLDIGCGWGALVMYAAEKYGVHALGVTLSEKQAAFANERIAAQGLADRARVELCDYRDLNVTEPFDRIVSVGMFEHVGRPRVPEYLGHAYRYLKPGGLFLNHGIALGRVSPAENKWREELAGRFLRKYSFRERYVFPDGDLESVNEVNLLAERAGFEVRDVESFREHYARTLTHWVARLEAYRADAIRLVGETTYRTWRLYMSGSAYHFARGNLNVYQSLLAKQEADGASHVPWSRADLYL